MWLEKVESHELMVVEKIFLENTDSGMFPEYYREFQENHYLDIDIKQVTDVIFKPETEDKNGRI